MKKAFLLLAILLLPILVLAEDFRPWWQSGEVRPVSGFDSFMFSLFSIAVSPTQRDETNYQEGFLIPADFFSDQDCSDAELRLSVQKPDGSFYGGYQLSNTPFWKGATHGPVTKNQQLAAKTIRFTPSEFVEGTWKATAFLYCNDNKKHIQQGPDDEVTFTLIKKGAVICTEGFVGKTFCGDDYTTVYKQYRTCNPSIIQNKVLKDCDAYKCDPNTGDCGTGCVARDISLSFCKGNELWKRIQERDCSERAVKIQACSKCEANKCTPLSGTTSETKSGIQCDEIVRCEDYTSEADCYDSPCGIEDCVVWSDGEGNFKYCYTLTAAEKKEDERIIKGKGVIQSGEELCEEPLGLLNHCGVSRTKKEFQDSTDDEIMDSFCERDNNCIPREDEGDTEYSEPNCVRGSTVGVESSWWEKAATIDWMFKILGTGSSSKNVCLVKEKGSFDLGFLTEEAFAGIPWWGVIAGIVVILIILSQLGKGRE